MFVYQPTFNVLDLTKHKGTEYITAWKPKGLFKASVKSFATDYKTIWI